MLSQIPSVNYLLSICNLFSGDFGWYNEHFENGRSSRLYRTVQLEEAGAIEVIEVLQEDENKNLYTAAFDIIDTWFKGKFSSNFLSHASSSITAICLAIP